MHYELSFQKNVSVPAGAKYINECCWGGDVIRDQLLPAISAKYGKADTGEEDWGWFIWCRRDRMRLAVDIFCEDPAKSEFRLRVYAGIRKYLIFWPEVDTPELHELKDLVRANLEAWGCAVREDWSA